MFNANGARTNIILTGYDTLYRIFSLAESLVGVESLVSHPATMTHASMPEDIRVAAGITDGMLRLSLGVEDPVDLVADLRAGLDRALALG